MNPEEVPPPATPAPAAPGATGAHRLPRPLRVSGGFLLLLAGIPLLVLPGPGAPAIFLGLNLLAVDFPWAKRLLLRLRAGTDELQRRLFKRQSGLGRARDAASGWTRRIGRRRPKTGESGEPDEPGKPGGRGGPGGPGDATKP